MEAPKSSGRVSTRLIVVAVLLGSIAVSVFVFGGDGSVFAQRGVPYDDAWIHFVFARNLAECGTLGLNEGVWGGGTTSPLWDLVLAISYSINHDLAFDAKVLAIIQYLGLYGLLFTLTVRWVSIGNRDPWWSLVFCLTVGSVGALTYLAFTGMDTFLFLCFGMLAIVLFERKIYHCVGIALAALILTRIEGLGLTILIGSAVLYLLVRKGYDRRRLIPVFLPPVAALIGYLSLNWLTTGVPLPTTMTGRKWLVGLDSSMIQFSLPRARQYIHIWCLYLEDWVFMTSNLEVIPLLSFFHRMVIWGFLGVGTIIAIVRSVHWLQKPRQRGSGLVLFLGWVLVHNVTYLFLFPVAVIRHQAVNLLWAATALGMGIVALVSWLMSNSKWQGLVLGLLAIAFVGFTSTSVVGWRRTWDAHVRHIESVHVRAGQWINQALPSEAVVAAFDIGAVKYFGKRTVVDLGALSDAEFMLAVEKGRATEYMHAHGVTHLAMPEHVGWGRDLGQALGVTGSSSRSAYQLVLLATWEVAPYDIQVPHSRLPTYLQYPAYPRMSIYRVDWR